MNRFSMLIVVVAWLYAGMPLARLSAQQTVPPTTAKSTAAKPGVDYTQPFGPPPPMPAEERGPLLQNMPDSYKPMLGGAYRIPENYDFSQNYSFNYGSPYFLGPYPFCPMPYSYGAGYRPSGLYPSYVPPRSYVLPESISPLLAPLPSLESPPSDNAKTPAPPPPKQK